MSHNFPDNTLIVTADGTHAKLYRNHSGDGSLKLKATGDVSPKDLANDGPAGNRPVEQSPNETDEATFAKQLAEYLNQQAHAGKFQKLVLAADPQTLGQMRPSLHKEVTDRMLLELPKTLTTSSVSDVERSIAAG